MAAIKNKQKCESRESKFLQRGILLSLPEEDTAKLPSVNDCWQKSRWSSRSRSSNQNLELKEAEAELRAAEISCQQSKEKSDESAVIACCKAKESAMLRQIARRELKARWRLQEPIKYEMKAVILQAKPSLKF